VSCTFDEV